MFNLKVALFIINLDCFIANYQLISIKLANFIYKAHRAIFVCVFKLIVVEVMERFQFYLISQLPESKANKV